MRSVNHSLCFELAMLLLMAVTWGGVAAAAAPATAPAAAAKKAATGGGTVNAKKAKTALPPPSAIPPNWVITAYRSDTSGNVFYNNETVKLGLTLSSRDAQKPLVVRGGTWRIKEIDDQAGWPWRADTRIAESPIACAEGQVAPATGQSVNLAIEWKPTRMGVFGIYLQVDDGSGASEEMVWGFAVAYPPAPGPKPNSPIIFNLSGDSIPRLAAAHKRLGAKWIRWEAGWNANEPQPGEWTWDRTDAWVKAAADNDLRITAIMGHAPTWATPKIEGKWTIFYWGQFPETNATPQYLPQLQEWARRFVERYKDTIRCGDVLNEPWEGGSLSGWHGNGAHYREILKSVSLGAHAADPTFTIVANDSSMNVEDNILTAPGTIDLLDAVSIHTYRSYNAFVMPEMAAYGRKVWDTESWIGVGPSDVVHQLVFELAQGIVKGQPTNVDHVWLMPKQADVLKMTKKKTDATSVSPVPAPPYASPTGQAMNVLLHFIEDTDFYREPRPESLPWMFVFKGRPGGAAPDKNAAVILGREDMWSNFPWYRITADGEMTIADPQGVLSAYDVKGTPLPRSGSEVKIPLTTRVYYVVSSRGADDLIEHLRSATVRGLQPVQLAAHDFTRPLSQHPPLRVEITNAYNVPISGTVEINAPQGWVLAGGSSKAFADLKPGETTEVSFQVAQAKETPANRYPFTITVRTDKGSAELKEALSAAVFIKGTPPVEGTAADWQKLGAVPVYLAGGTTAADSFLQYAMPFLNLTEQNDTAYIAQFMGMWDENNFYILADINDPTEKLRPSMEKGTWFNMYAPPNDFEYWGGQQAPPAGAGDAFNFGFNILPYGQKQIANYPPAAQQKLEPRWRVNCADYEYSLYLGRQNKLAPGDYEKALAEAKQAGKQSLRQPNFIEVGPPVMELWRLMAPGLARHNYLPSSPRDPKEQGLVKDASLKVTREGNVYHYRAAIPWSEMPLVKALAMENRAVGFTFQGKNDGRVAVSWSNASRSVARQAQEVMHPTYEGNWSPDTQWGFVDLTQPAKP